MTKKERTSKQMAAKVAPCSITHEQAFLDYCAMQVPSVPLLAAFYKKQNMAKPPSKDCLNKWCRKYDWVARRQSGIVEIKDFSAKDELRTIAAHITTLTKAALTGQMTTVQKESLGQSQHISRLVTSLIDAVKTGEELVGSLEEKKVEEARAQPEERRERSTSNLAVAMAHFKKLGEQGTKVQ